MFTTEIIDGTIIFNYDLPCQSPHKQTVIIDDKLNTARMKRYASNCLTLLDCRMDEFFEVVEFSMSRLFQDQIKNLSWQKKYWQWKDFHDAINNKRNHGHYYAKNIYDNIHLYQQLIPNEKLLEGWKIKLQPIVDDIKKTANQSFRTLGRLHEELKKADGQ